MSAHKLLGVWNNDMPVLCSSITIHTAWCWKCECALPTHTAVSSALDVCVALARLTVPCQLAVLATSLCIIRQSYTIEICDRLLLTWA